MRRGEVDDRVDRGCYGRRHERRSKSTFAAVQLPRSWSAATTRAHAARQDPLDRYPGRSRSDLRGAAVAIRRVCAGRGGNPCIGRGTARAASAGSIRTDVRPSIHRPSMRDLMLMWADADATSGNESDLQAWLDFDERVKANGAFVVTEHSPPPRPMLASCKPRQLGPRSTGRWNADRSPTATGRFRPSTSWISPTWTPRSSGRTSCQPTATLRSANCCSSDQSFVVPARHCCPSRPRPAHIRVARRCAIS